ncbi:hypothetical protein ISN45_At01g051450 [Arabidopsis thaliana x Arabidopsis arenosa]|uniref:Uncharacterized protein n=1 Tax=Arabidopsis thaliana x Arabidopsis arenosa TaxID=1240361 RepID=A0A8T2GS97_9BRAS|nr:hypothetical protein ISN45_At01g051450 [Arabidopsis thaliana x Arabidopsis arenosa]
MNEAISSPSINIETPFEQTRSIKTSGEPKNFELTGVVGEEDQPPREASERGAFDESKLVDVNIALSWEAFEVKQGTETEGLREELQEGVCAANCGWILNYVSDVVDEAEKVEAKLRSIKEKVPLVSEEFADVDCGQSNLGRPASEDEVESKPSKSYDPEDHIMQD